ncbi:MAG: sigma-70 family RNA polymerase sigma factor [Acidobacteriota bacterium]|nr:sigma-70 family RNA polymerase sigma factor [Acidobacteriota bacterium]
MALKSTDPENPYSTMNPPELSAVMPVVYDELRRLARRYMAKERGAQTLQATALVNEAWIRLAGTPAPVWKDRAHFCAIAAHAMRELLVERARARAARKRGGSRVRVSLNEEIAAENTEMDLLPLNAALDKLQTMDPDLGRIVELRFFGGLSIEETAAALDCSTATVKRGWQLARAWLRREMGADGES